MKSSEEMIKRVLERRDAELEKRKKKRLVYIRYAAAVSALCFVAVIGIGVSKLTDEQKDLYDFESIQEITDEVSEPETESIEDNGSGFVVIPYDENGELLQDSTEAHENEKTIYNESAGDTNNDTASLIGSPGIHEKNNNSGFTSKTTRTLSENAKTTKTAKITKNIKNTGTVKNTKAAADTKQGSFTNVSTVTKKVPDKQTNKITNAETAVNEATKPITKSVTRKITKPVITDDTEERAAMPNNTIESVPAIVPTTNVCISTIPPETETSISEPEEYDIVDPIEYNGSTYYFSRWGNYEDDISGAGSYNIAGFELWIKPKSEDEICVMYMGQWEIYVYKREY